jgi:hypothetical protein
MSGTNLQLTAVADGDNFTIVKSGNVVDVYYNEPETGTPIATVAASDLSSITISGVGKDTVTIDESGGNPLPANVEVTSGAVVFSQDLGTGGTAANLTVDSGAAVDFSGVEDLSVLTVQGGASVNVIGSGTAVVNAKSIILGGVVNLGAGALVVTSAGSAGGSTFQAQLLAGETVDASDGVVSSDAVVTSDGSDPVEAVGDPSEAPVGTVVAAPVGDFPVLSVIAGASTSNVTIPGTGGVATTTITGIPALANTGNVYLTLFTAAGAPNGPVGVNPAPAPILTAPGTVGSGGTLSITVPPGTPKGTYILLIELYTSPPSLALGSVQVTVTVN